MNIIFKQDGEGVIAFIENHTNIFAYAATEKEAHKELIHVLEMMVSVHKEQLEIEEKAYSQIQKNYTYAL